MKQNGVILRQLAGDEYIVVPTEGDAINTVLKFNETITWLWK